MSIPQLKGKILFVFSDPGGAKPCLSLTKGKSNSDILAVSDRDYSFYSDFEVPVRLFKGHPASLLDSFVPDLIFTGTSYTSEIERSFIALAKEKGIPCWSFVDHWTDISKRFVNRDGELVLPDLIWVIDDRAKRIGVEEAIDADKLIVTGNPYHYWLADWKPSIIKEEFLKMISHDILGKKLVVFAPDPLSNINGKDIYGFDELTATAKIVLLLNQHKHEVKNWVILIKAHPNQNINALKDVINYHPSIIVVGPEVNVNDTIFFADAIIGFFSSFLLEASIMRKPIIRFLNDDLENDPFGDLKIGKITNDKALIGEISKYLQ